MAVSNQRDLIKMYLQMIWYTKTDLSSEVGGCAAHIVVYGGQHGDGLLGDVDAGKDHRSFRYAGQALFELLWGQVV